VNGENPLQLSVFYIKTLISFYGAAESHHHPLSFCQEETLVVVACDDFQQCNNRAEWRKLSTESKQVSNLLDPGLFEKVY